MVLKQEKTKTEILKKLYYGELISYGKLVTLPEGCKNMQDFISYLEMLKKDRYIWYGENSITREFDNKDIVDSRTNINWDHISINDIYIKDMTILEKGSQFLRKSISEDIYETRKKAYWDKVHIQDDYGKYAKVSINTENIARNNILIDSDLVPLLKEYSWSINKDGMIITKHHYKRKDNRNKSIDQILFEDELTKLNRYNNVKHIAYYINGNNSDKRRENIEFVSRKELYARKNLNTITGIYLSSSNSDSHISYEVRINRTRRQIYLCKTTDYTEALYGAFLLRCFLGGRDLLVYSSTN